MKIPPMETELFHTDRRKDTTKLKVNFRNYETAPNKNESLLPLQFWSM